MSTKPGVQPSNAATTANIGLPKLAVIGCGAAAKEFCLPVLAKIQGFESSIVLVDKLPSQAESVAAEFGIQNHCDDFRRLPFEVDAAVITTPHHLHAEQAIHFLEQGIAVMVEKPLGMSAEEAEAMITAAKRSGATLMVNNCRRMFPSYREVARRLHSGDLGEIRKVEIFDGSPFDWNSVSDFYLKNPELAKGVFLDRGAHTVDLVCWWLSQTGTLGTAKVIEAQYDALGGGEARINIHLCVGPTEVQLAFSRLHKLENRYSVECERGTISGRLFQSAMFDLNHCGKTETIQAGKPLLYNEYAFQLLENFIKVVKNQAKPYFTADEVTPSIALIDEIYRCAVPFDMPWYDADPNIAQLGQLIARPNH